MSESQDDSIPVKGRYHLGYKSLIGPDYSSFSIVFPGDFTCQMDWEKDGEEHQAHFTYALGVARDDMGNEFEGIDFSLIPEETGIVDPPYLLSLPTKYLTEGRGNLEFTHPGVLMTSSGDEWIALGKEFYVFVRDS